MSDGPREYGYEDEDEDEFDYADDDTGNLDIDLRGEPLDLTTLTSISRPPIPHEERTRRILLGVSGAAWLLLGMLNIGFALILSPEKYQGVGAAISAMLTVAGALVGAVAG